MLTKQVFRIIQSHDQEEWYRKVTDVALFIATGGFLDEANRLLQALWKYNLPHDRNTWLPDQAFEVLWYAAGERPGFVPFGPTDIDTIEIQHRAYCSGDRYGYNMPQLVWTEYKGQDAFRMAIIHASLKDGQWPDTQTELICLQLLQQALSDITKPGGYAFCDVTSLAAELAAKNNKEDLAIQMTKAWGKHSYENYNGYSFSIMASNRHVAPLLLNGIIADELKLDKVVCKEFVDKAIRAIDERMEKGVSLVYGDLSWNELLEKLSILSIKKELDGFTEEQKENNWIGHQPANPFVITDTEKRLGLELPDDYKDFLKVSNGFPVFPLVNPQLLPVEEIDLLQKIYTLNGNVDSFERIKDYYDKEKGTLKEYVERAIVISLIPDEQEIWLIAPEKSNDQWQCWFFAYWIPGEYRYQSFRHFIEEQIQQLDED